MAARSTQCQNRAVRSTQGGRVCVTLLTRKVFVWSTPLLLYTVNLEEKYLMLIEILFDIYENVCIFPCSCIILQYCWLFVIK